MRISLNFNGLFSLYVQVKDYQNILKIKYWQLAFTSNKAYFQNKKRSETSLLASFSAWFLKKTLLTLYSINWQNLIIWLPLLFQKSDNVCIVMFVIQFLTSDILKFTLAFLSSCFSTWSKKSGEKFKYLKNENKFLDEIKSITHHF